MSSTTVSPPPQDTPSSPPPAPPQTPRTQDPPTGRAGGPRKIPVRDVLVDVAGLGALGALAVLGFQTAYGGTRFFLAGVVGLAAGMCLAWIGARVRSGALTTAAAAVVVYLVLGGVVVAPASTLLGFVPTPDSIAAMIDGAVSGWARLLTSLPPVGDADNLLAVPFLCGLLCGLLSLTVSLRTRRPLVALIFPVIVLGLGILFGTETPANPVLQGSVFCAIALAWASYRYRARRRVDTGGRRSTRWVGLVAMLGLAVVVSAVIGDSIPGAGRPRVVLRDDVEPPFDPNDYPSPLAGFRRFTNGPTDNTEIDRGREPSDGWRHSALFEVRGLPDDERLRLATLDTYNDGIVYEVGSGSGSSGYFQRVGTLISPDLGGAEGTERTVVIDVLDGQLHSTARESATDDAPLAGAREVPYTDIWLPLPEHPSAISFESSESSRSAALTESLRLNVATGTAAVPHRLDAGDSYSVTYLDVQEPTRDVAAQAALSSVSLPQPYAVAAVQAARMFWDGPISRCRQTVSDDSVDAGVDAGAAPGPIQQVFTISDNLRGCGGLDDGRQGLGGHGAARLAQMMPAAQGAMVGNGEQFAPLAALMADAIGVDARVVMGFRSRERSNAWRTANPQAELPPSPEGVYVVAGNDIDAWIEVRLEGLGWVPVDVTPEDAEPVVLPQPQAVAPQNEPPPPPPSIPPSEEDEVETDTTNTRDPCELDPDQPRCSEDEGGIPWGAILKYASIPLIPVAFVALVTGIIAWLKSRRRGRRRSEGPADARVSGGWDEVTDLACDLGSPVPPKLTRREAAGLIGNSDAAQLSRHADGAVFGPHELTDRDVDSFWDEVDAVRASMVSHLSRFGRWKVLVNLSSLRLSAQRRRQQRRAAGAGRGTGAPGRPRRGGPQRSSGPLDRLLPGASPGMAPVVDGGSG